MDVLQVLTNSFGIHVETTFGESPYQSMFRHATPLIRVIERGDEPMAKLLVNELGADPNHIVTNPTRPSYCIWPDVGNTALLTAIYTGNASMIKCLVQELGANINLKTPKHIKYRYRGTTLVETEVTMTQTPLLFSIETENHSMVQLILSLGGDPLVNGWTKSKDNLLICGNALQLAKIRFEGRNSDVIDVLSRATAEHQRILNPNHVTSEQTDNSDESNLDRVNEKLATYSRFLFNMKKNVECNICLDVPTAAKLYICQNSHNFCEVCIQRVRECPLCKVNFLMVRPIRNRLAEATINDMTNMNLRDSM